jgi:hypothetical protein
MTAEDEPELNITGWIEKLNQICAKKAITEQEAQILQAGVDKIIQGMGNSLNEATAWMEAELERVKNG